MSFSSTELMEQADKDPHLISGTKEYNILEKISYGIGFQIYVIVQRNHMVLCDIKRKM
jgi:hypothetical protein